METIKILLIYKNDSIKFATLEDIDQPDFSAGIFIHDELTFEYLDLYHSDDCTIEIYGEI